MRRFGSFFDKVRNDAQSLLFGGLYVAVAAATFRHSTVGFASFESGSLLWGALSALAVDVGMALSATGLRKVRNWPLAIGLLVSAAASVFTQLLYSVSHAQAVTVAPGAEWMGGAAVGIIQVRVLVLPALLPLLSVVYAFAAKMEAPVRHGERSGLERAVAEIRAGGGTLTEQAARVWELSGNGWGDFGTADVARLVGCSESTARGARE